MKVLFSLFLLFSLAPLEATACDASQRAQFDCREWSISMNQRCNPTNYQNFTCTSQRPDVSGGDIGKRCVVCWDRTLEHSRSGGRRDNSGRIIGKNLSEQEAQQYSRGNFGATGQ